MGSSSYNQLIMKDRAFPYIFQGGMGAGISLCDLSSQVALNGGFGTISSVALDIFTSLRVGKKLNLLEAVEREIGDTLKKAGEYSQNIGINIMGKLRYSQKIVEGAIKAGCQNIIWGAGLPLDLPQLTMDTARKFNADFNKINLIPIISSGVMFEKLCNIWKTKYQVLPDAVICEGPLAGGHIAWNANKVLRWGSDFFKKFDLLTVLLPEMLKVAKKFIKPDGRPVPVIVAGGFYDKKGIHEAMERGASGVQLGTRFLMSNESGASQAFKQAMLETGEEDIAIPTDDILSPCDFTFSRSNLSPINEFWSIRNNKDARHFCICVSLLRAAGVDLIDNCTGYSCPYGYVLPKEGEPCPAAGNVIPQAIYTCGRIAGKVNDILPVSQIMKNLMEYQTDPV